MFGRASGFRLSKSRVMMSSKASLMPPNEPVNFSNKFFIPEQTGKMMLEELNPHPLDSKISFEPSAHKYYYDGVLMDQSVTEVVGNFFEKFDADLVARRMIAGNNWPRPEYTRRNGEPYTVRPTHYIQICSIMTLMYIKLRILIFSELFHRILGRRNKEKVG